MWTGGREFRNNYKIFKTIKLFGELGCLYSQIGGEDRGDNSMKDKIMQWFVRLIRLDMGYFIFENKERNRCFKIYITKTTDSDKTTEQHKRERK